MTKASELVSLAESITGKLGALSSDAAVVADNGGEVTLASLLTQLDIHNPVTRDMAGEAYYEELAREFAGFMVPVLNSKSSMVALTDAYCLFNRARGVELVSPQDLRKACALCDDMQLPIRIRQFSSGLLAIQPDILYLQYDEAIARRILSEIPEDGSISSVELARSLEMPPTLAIEQLLMAESMGTLCRDEHAHALRFYANRIQACTWRFSRDGVVDQ
ncbi:EAP30/Vps36 family-domain-containing protein [Syncephalis pseudoplumigaleata]|uniref:Vacuolar protein-sorting-associated protein 36 n=1 Tax=Syncephalis pseudoplumigaleata TaxID=1712513 RepID=A0A4P9YZQ5_9FUNG|nr:EAP30/Vps36 family-domain-containing protein [Syncephalis pseudoplumigaleata]|eukprot:RKP25657.1 EAP30/Vps36 family-domain-containing protein [Syncephalis pseudoplumigaleata]